MNEWTNNFLLYVLFDKLLILMCKIPSIYLQKGEKYPDENWKSKSNFLTEVWKHQSDQTKDFKPWCKDAQIN